MNKITATRVLARLATVAIGSVMIVGGAAPAHAAAPAEPSAINTEALDRLAEQAHARGLFNGTLLVARNGRIVYKRATGVADGARTRALTTRDRFGIGSIGKEFSAVALMMLERQGALRLDDPVSRFVPGLPAWGDQVLVRHLLDYTSGLPGLRPNAAGDSLLADLRALPALQFAPGTGYLYSNNNIVLRRSVIEAAARTSFADYAQRMLLRPCGMRDAVIDPPPGRGLGAARARREAEPSASALHI